MVTPLAAGPRTPVRAPKTAELIAAQLRRQIVRGELTPGETLPPEMQLVGEFGVSRPTLREAFRILETETLISVRRGSRGGAQVTTPDSSVAGRHVGVLLQMRDTHILDVYEARMVIEPHCARLLAARRTPGDLADLRAATAALADLIDAGPEHVPESREWSEKTYRFHELLFQRCGNKTLAVQCEVLADIVAGHLRQSIARGFAADTITPARFRRTIRSFAKLVDILESGAPDAAEDHWRKHMEATGRVLFATGGFDTTVVDLFS